MKTEIKLTENGISFQIPFVNKQAGSDFDLDKARMRNLGYAYDLLGSFSARLIASLERRMKACFTNLINHINDIEYSDGCGQIIYQRKDGSFGKFNVTSYNIMDNAISLLKDGKWKQFLESGIYLDQTLKALLNDTEQDHSDEGSFKYSELVSLLCEFYAHDAMESVCSFEDEV